MLLVMSENTNGPERRGIRDRFNDHVRTDADEIQDWINGNGALVLGGILIAIAIYGFFVLVF